MCPAATKCWASSRWLRPEPPPVVDETNSTRTVTNLEGETGSGVRPETLPLPPLCALRGPVRSALVADAGERARAATSVVASTIAGAAARLRPGAASRAPWERSVLDDVAMRRPWNLVVKAARVRARTRLQFRPLDEGVTVLVVSWNTREVLADVLQAIRCLSPSDTRVLVVDNASTDGSREMLRAWSGVETMLLPANVGHGVALDLGVCRVRTRVTVTLDSDAIPLRDDWLTPVVDPIRSGRAVLAGSRSRREFVHPMYLAADTEAFVQRALSFQVHVEPGLDPSEVRWGVNAWDTAELMSRGLAPDEVVLIDRTENAAEGLPGMTAGGVVYHHGGMSRSADGGLTAEAVAGWRAACTALGIALDDVEHR